MAKSIVSEKAYQFAIKIVQLYLKLKDDRHYALADQVLRCGTSIGANIEEALNGYSRKDFAAKMSISSKEARECRYWLRLMRDTGLIDENTANELISEVEEISKMLTSIVKSTSEK